MAAWLRSRPLDPLPITITAVRTVMPSLNPTSHTVASTNVPRPTPTPNLIPTPSPTYIPPHYSDDTIIRLLGPPPDSTFAPSTTISFYWQWPLPLTTDQLFHVYLFVDEQATLLGTIREPNIGASYHLSVDLADVEITADTAAQWVVQLETSQQTQPLRMSKSRSLTLLISTSLNK